MGRTSSVDFAAEATLALYRAKRAALNEQETFNLGEFASILEMTRTNLKQQYVAKDPEFPCEAMGDEGRDYVINGCKALDHLIRRLEEKILKQEKRSARLMELAGVRAADTEADKLTLQEIREASRIQRGNQKDKIEQNRYVSESEHTRVVADLCSTVAEDYQSVSTEIDAAGLWDKQIRDDVDDYFRTRQLRLYERFGKYLTEDGAVTAETGARA